MKNNFSYTIIILLLIVPLRVTARTMTDIRIVNEDQKSVVLEFTPHIKTEHVAGIHGSVFTRFRFFESQTTFDSLGQTDFHGATPAPTENVSVWTRLPPAWPITISGMLRIRTLRGEVGLEGSVERSRRRREGHVCRWRNADLEPSVQGSLQREIETPNVADRLGEGKVLGQGVVQARNQPRRVGSRGHCGSTAARARPDLPAGAAPRCPGGSRTAPSRR